MRTALELLEQIQFQLVGLIPSEEDNDKAMQKILEQLKQAVGVDFNVMI